EMFGQVTEVGAEVTSAVVGDFGLFTVRRGCGNCLACMNLRNDLCYTGQYTERGIKGADGFQAEYVVDKENYFVPVPETLKDIGVLTEPMSVAAKAIDEALTIQGARLKNIIPSVNWLEGKKAIIAGIGAIGLMAAFALRLKGADVIGLDIVDEDSLRPRILKEIGGTYVDGRAVETTNLDEVCGEADFIFEATGIAKLQIQLIDALAVNGIYVATGIPHGHRPVTVMAGDLMKQLVLKNQILLGSVNASLEHYNMAVTSLEACKLRWPEAIGQIITEKIPYTDFASALHQHDPDEIKVVVDWKSSSLNPASPL
ncbi:MAG: zinc-binding dehydrogenase, partial [Flavisolibacter sp.]